MVKQQSFVFRLGCFVLLLVLQQNLMCEVKCASIPTSDRKSSDVGIDGNQRRSLSSDDSSDEGDEETMDDGAQGIDHWSSNDERMALTGRPRSSGGLSRLLGRQMRTPHNSPASSPASSPALLPPGKRKHSEALPFPHRIGTSEHKRQRNNRSLHQHRQEQLHHREQHRQEQLHHHEQYRQEQYRQEQLRREQLHHREQPQTRRGHHPIKITREYTRKGLQTTSVRSHHSPKKHNFCPLAPSAGSSKLIPRYLFRIDEGAKEPGESASANTSSPVTTTTPTTLSTAARTTTPTLTSAAITSLTTRDSVDIPPEDAHQTSDVVLSVSDPYRDVSSRYTYGAISTPNSDYHRLRDPPHQPTEGDFSAEEAAARYLMNSIANDGEGNRCFRILVVCCVMVVFGVIGGLVVYVL